MSIRSMTERDRHADFCDGEFDWGRLCRRGRVRGVLHSAFRSFAGPGMLFNSLEFAVFFGIVFALYLCLPHRAQNRLLLLASYVF